MRGSPRKLTCFCFPFVFLIRFQEALRQYSTAIATLNQIPETLNAFADHVSAQKRFRADFHILARLSDQVELMYDLLMSSTHKLQLPSQDAVLLDELRGARKQFAERLALEWERSRQHLPKMREQVDQGIARLNLELHEIEQILAQGRFSFVFCHFSINFCRFSTDFSRFSRLTSDRDVWGSARRSRCRPDRAGSDR
jgi:hypothetical protein